MPLTHCLKLDSVQTRVEFYIERGVQVVTGPLANQNSDKAEGSIVCWLSKHTACRGSQPKLVYGFSFIHKGKPLHYSRANPLPHRTRPAASPSYHFQQHCSLPQTSGPT